MHLMKEKLFIANEYKTFVRKKNINQPLVSTQSRFISHNCVLFEMGRYSKIAIDFLLLTIDAKFNAIRY